MVSTPFASSRARSAAGKTWRSYQEDMRTPCRHPAIGQDDHTLAARPGDMYATRHNPFVYFHSVIDTPACARRVVDLEVLATDPGATKDFEHFCTTTGCELLEASEQPGGVLRFVMRKPG